MYRFHLVQCHPKVGQLTCWYLELRSDDADTLMKVHRGVTKLYYFKYRDQDPNGFYNPIMMAARWLQSVDSMLFEGTILINNSGGIIRMDGGKIIDTIESDNLHWFDRYSDERITIGRWPQGKHWYLSSNKDRVFIPGKFNDLEDAIEEARCYVSAERIQVREFSGMLPAEP